MTQSNSPSFIDGQVGKIALHDLGGTGDEVLLISHATGFLGKVYQAFARELHGDVRVLAIDFRAHGDSDAPTSEGGFSWLGMADDLERVVESIGAATLHGFGHSMGGAALLEVERQNPGTFTSAMVFEPILPTTRFTDGDSPLVQAALGRLRTFPSYSEALLRYATRPPLGLFRADVLTDYVKHGFAEASNGVTLKCLPENEAQTFKSAGTIPFTGLSDIDLPVVVAQSGDGQIPAQLAATIADAMPNASLMTFPTITHFGPLQDPVIVANAMRRLMSGH